MKQPGLLAGIGFYLECRFIRPRNVEASRYAHDVDGTVSFALLSCGFVFCGVPCVGNFLSCIVEGEVRIVALRGSHHSNSPVFGHNRNPIPGQVDERTVLGIAGRWTPTLWV